MENILVVTFYTPVVDGEYYGMASGWRATGGV
jgi:hypothetical protein